MGGQKRTITGVPLAGKTVLVQTDLAAMVVGADSDTLVLQYNTIRYLLAQKCRVILVGTFLRPDGVDPRCSTVPAAQTLANTLKVPVHVIPEAVGPKAIMAIKRSRKVGVVVLENLRFYPAEEAASPRFAEQLVEATKARYFIQDDPLAVRHTSATTVLLPQLLPAVAGYALGNATGPGVKSLLDA